MTKEGRVVPRRLHDLRGVGGGTTERWQYAPPTGGIRWHNTHVYMRTLLHPVWHSLMHSLFASILYGACILRMYSSLHMWFW